MKIKMHWIKGDDEDSIILEADTEEELRALAAQEVEKRGLEQCEYWSVFC
jgi:hypothetical protein